MNPLLKPSNTDIMTEDIGSCVDPEDFAAFLRGHEAEFNDWHAKYHSLMRDNSLTDQMVAVGCDISKSTANSFRKSVPSKRDNVIMIAAMMGLPIKETDRFLTRYARYPKLHAKNLNDCLWMFILANGGHERPAAYFQSLHARLEAELADLSLPSTENDLHSADPEAELHEKKLMEHMSTFSGFCDYVKNTASEYENTNESLLGYIDAQIKAAGISDVRSGYANSMFAGNNKYRKRYYREREEKLKRGLPPSREFIILLGIYLNMSVEQINNLLAAGYFLPLLSKDKLEAAVYYILCDAEIKAPRFFDSGTTLLNDEEIYCQLARNGLPSYVRMKLNEMSALGYLDQNDESVVEFLSFL